MWIQFVVTGRAYEKFLAKNDSDIPRAAFHDRALDVLCGLNWPLGVDIINADYNIALYFGGLFI